MNPTDSLHGAIVSFLNYRDGMAIDLKQSGGSEKGNVIFSYPFHGHENQQWRLERVMDGRLWPVFMIRNVQFGTCIDLNGTANGTYVSGWPGSDGTNRNQLWRFISADTTGHAFIIQNVGNNMVLDLKGGSREPRTPIQGYTMTPSLSNRNQIWRILRMD